ncbi:MAG: DUF1538 family protein [Bacteroidales bacterium]|nr:DUF1538 family protein [Bacteroidales bacterium]
MNDKKALWSEAWDTLKEKLKESLISVLPVTLIVFGLSVTPWVDISLGELGIFGLSAVFLILGMSLFNLGADMAMTPMGQYIGEGLTKSKKLGVLVGVAFLMGLLITVAEPDLAVLAGQVAAVMNGTTLIMTVGIGVGLMLLLGVAKIIFRFPLTGILVFGYMLIFALTSLLLESGKAPLLALSFDSGGVTTGPITVPFIMALGVGIALTVGGRSASENSFGLIALCSLGPIIAVLALSLFSNGNMEFTVPNYSMGSILDVSTGMLVFYTMLAVARSLILIVLAFFVLQFTILKLPKTQIIRILFGIAYAFVGLVLFLSAVEMAFMPIGYKIGLQMSHQNPVVLMCFAFILGMVVVMAEPAVHVLNSQVNDITGGEVSRKQMMTALSLGVGISIGLSVLRAYWGFSVLYYLVPGYLISLGL